MIDVLERLKLAQEAYPGMRIGQLIANAIRMRKPSFVCPELYYLDDASLMQLLDNFDQLVQEASKVKGLDKYGE